MTGSDPLMFLNNKILLVATKTERILLFRTSSCLNSSKNNDMRDKCDSYPITSEMFPVPRSTPCHSCLVQYVNIANYAFSCAMELSPRTYTQSYTAHHPPPLGFWYVAIFQNGFAFSRKPLIFFRRWGIFYGWWRCWRSVTSPNMVAILAAILDFVKN